MHILLINVPSRKGRGGKSLPLGLLYLGGIIERRGHSVHIADPYNCDQDLIEFDNGDYSEIDEKIKKYCPNIIGFGGIASSYGRTKKLSEYIHLHYPEIFQIAGGPLASVYELLLEKTHIDLVFHGETEYTFPPFLDKFEKNENWRESDGISYRKNDKIIRNHLAPQIENLDTIPFPSYHLIKLEDYCTPIIDIADSYSAEGSNSFSREKFIEKFSVYGSMILFMTSRGCTNKCSFCYRHMKGYRQHSVSYVINHIKFLNSRYGIRGFEFGDELFNFKKEWVMDFCNALEKEKLDIYYRILGARVDRMDKDMLLRLKDTGCIYIAYGQESGSEMILKEYKKGVTPQKNKEITLLSKECGLLCPVQIVIGSPGETHKSIYETIQFLIDVKAVVPSVNYLLPFPETPIWQYVRDNNLIPDIENYLDAVAERGGSPIVNLTQVPNRVWMYWGAMIQYEMKLNNYWINRQYISYFALYPVIKVMNLLLPYIPKKIIAGVRQMRTVFLH